MRKNVSSSFSETFLGCELASFIHSGLITKLTKSVSMELVLGLNN